MLLQLRLEGLVVDGACARGVCVLEERHREVLDLLRREAHPVLVHARHHHLLHLPLRDQAVACTQIRKVLILSLKVLNE